MEITKTELLRKLPPAWEQVVSLIQSVSEHCHFEEHEQDWLVDEVGMGDRQFLIILSRTQHTITFVDDVTSFDEAHNELPYAPIQALIELAKQDQMHFYNRGDGNDRYYWYGLEVKASTFRVEALKRFVAAWDAYQASVAV